MEQGIPQNNIEIKELPDTSIMHNIESANNNVLNVALHQKVELEDDSFMSENKNFPENQIDQNQHLIENQSYEHEEENLKELPQRGEETDSTMNIKSFSNFESIKDSVKMENLKSPNTEIQDINIPQMNEDFIEEQVISNNLPKSKDDHNDFENNFYHMNLVFQDF